MSHREETFEMFLIYINSLRTRGSVGELAVAMKTTSTVHCCVWCEERDREKRESDNGVLGRCPHFIVLKRAN